MTVSIRVMSAGEGYKHVVRTVAASDGDRALSTPLTRCYCGAKHPQSMKLHFPLWSRRNEQETHATAVIFDTSEMTDFRSTSAPSTLSMDSA